MAGSEPQQPPGGPWLPEQCPFPVCAPLTQPPAPLHTRGHQGVERGMIAGSGTSGLAQRRPESDYCSAKLRPRPTLHGW